MGSAIAIATPKGCCCTGGGDATASTDMVSVEHGLEASLGPGTGFLKELRVRGISCDDECGGGEVALDYGREVSAGLRSGEGPDLEIRRQLLRAACNDDAPLTLQLVADGVDLGVVGEAMRLAAYRGSGCVVRELVAVGLSVSDPCPFTGMTSLQLAAASGHVLVCELLLDAMADVHRDGSRGPTAIALARKKGHVEVQEVIERHVAALLLAGRGDDQEDGPGSASVYGRAHVLPRVSPVLTAAVLGAMPAQAQAVVSEVVGGGAGTGGTASGAAAGCGEPDAAAGGAGASGLAVGDCTWPPPGRSGLPRSYADQGQWAGLPPQQVLPL